MAYLLFIIFVLVPIAEIALFIQIGDMIGLAATIALVIITALIGTSLLQIQGLSVFMKARKTIQEGDLPLDSVIDGCCLLIAGAFLLTPGFITDSAGFLLFIPPLRRALAVKIIGWILRSDKVHIKIFPDDTSKGSSDPDFSEKTNGPIIDGDYSHVDDIKTADSSPREKDNDENHKSPWRR